MHPLKSALIAYLKADRVSIKVPSKYADFANVFSPKLVAELPEYMRINDHAIELMDDWQPLYASIHSLDPIELEPLKAYIENNLANGFFRLSKAPAGALILFDKKPDNSLRLYVD